MSPVTVFLLGTCLTVAISLIVVVFLREPLRQILTDLCGTTERGRFWAAFSIVVLLLVPLWFALAYRPEAERKLPSMFELASLLQYSLFGLILSAAGLGFVLSLFISRREVFGSVEKPVNRAGLG